MKKLLVIAVLGLGGFILYKSVFASSEAYKVYERFADALAYDRWDAARDLAGSEEVKDMVDEQARLPTMIGYETYRTFRGVVHGAPLRSVESETSEDGGKKVTLKVIQDERRGSLTMSPVGRPTVRRRQDVVVVHGEDGWRVTEFREEVQSLESR